MIVICDLKGSILPYLWKITIKLPTNQPTSVLWRYWLGSRKGIQSIEAECWVLTWLSVWREV